MGSFARLVSLWIVIVNKIFRFQEKRDTATDFPKLLSDIIPKELKW